jgi:hypothetical protein
MRQRASYGGRPAPRHPWGAPWRAGGGGRAAAKRGAWRAPGAGAAGGARAPSPSLRWSLSLSLGEPAAGAPRGRAPAGARWLPARVALI